MRIRSIIAAGLVGASAAISMSANANADIRVPDSATVRMCPGAGAPKPLIGSPNTFEAVAFDHQGQMLVSDWIGSKVDKLYQPGATPRTLTDVYFPGGLAPHPDGSVLVGSGIAAPALLAPKVGTANLYKVNTKTGAKRKVAEGLSMGNGVALAPDGTVFASNDLVPAIDKISPNGDVQRGWYRKTPANGLAVSKDGKTLFANVSLGDTRILALDTDTGKSRTYFRPPSGLQWTSLDDLDIDSEGRLYAAVYFGGQVWRIDPSGSFCAVAKGLYLPAGVSVGPSMKSKFSKSSIYVTTHTGLVMEIPRAIPSASD